MSYFDHVRCPTCKAGFDPEKILVGLGGEANCPYCNAELRLKDFFGVKASMSEADDLDLDLDDLSQNNKDRPAWTGEGGFAPDPMEGVAMPPKRYRGRPQPGAQGRQGGQGSSDNPGTALEIMKRMKDDDD